MNRPPITGAAPAFLGLLLASFALISGCGVEKFPIRPAKGKVVCNGQPVTIGSVSFTPVGEPNAVETGKPASGMLDKDGTFVLTTNDRFDGAIVGKHNVRYFGPEGGDEETSSGSDDSSPAAAAKAAERAKLRKAQLQSLCIQKADIVVEVTADGPNDFTIELTPPGRPKPAS